ncbi:MAG: type VI secretion system contractile sheath small subunit [Succinivibrionaceae bacterium]|jgi:type VI secretion system protein ImpB|nr:type VI secretion system contractile sheath small subunit [Succinivibrionaceae bacterium]MBQ1426337.1 type VI secretion system contractile sheath small subunit [Succinivibrionaceae bacterium]MBQ8977906.1 type VI secretion system contractile sheath small subunit [Succinivibrionaceae bacterium]
MAMNAQHKRISKNRVSITYDVETNGATETKELPFVVGVMGSFTGDKPDDQKVEVEDREFVGIDKDNFDQVMSDLSPELTYKVDNTLADSGDQFEVNLKFNSMDDFKPENVVNQVEPLKKLMETRQKLKILLSKADRSRDLEKLLKEVLENTDNVASLAKELGLDGENK